MFDLANVNKRFFGVKIDNVSLEIEPPKLKVLRRIEKIKNNTENPTEDLINALKAVLNKNKSGYKVAEEFIEENFNTDEMSALLEVYFNWVGEIEKN